MTNAVNDNPEEENETHKTETIHMCAIIAAHTKDENPFTDGNIRRICLVLFSLILVMSHSSVLFMVIHESCISPCSAQQSECLTSTSGPSQNLSSTRTPSKLPPSQHPTTRAFTIAPTVLITEKPKSKKSPKTTKRSDDLSKQRESNQQCAYFEFESNKLTSGQTYVLIFVSLILDAQLSTDIEEATVEEAFLRENVETVSHPLAFIFILSLRHRRFVLPWVFVLSVVVIILTDDLLIKNILLNAAALDFILNVDTWLQKFFCHPSRGRPNLLRGNLVVGSHYSWWGPRVEAFIVALVVPVTVLKLN